MPLQHQVRRNPAGEVRKVFARNLQKELKMISKVQEKYRYITIDVEYPGLVHKTTVHPRLLSDDERYAIVKTNVDQLKIIQLGLTLSSDVHDDDVITWEFNFCGFNPMKDVHDPTSIEFLKSKGIDLFRNYVHGIRPGKFAKLFWGSRLPLNYGKTWISFHGAYEFAFLMKILSRQSLPDQFHQFLYDMTLCFGNEIYDVKHLTKSCNGMHGGLDNIAKLLNLQRPVGCMHQAGSDSHLIWAVYKRIMDKYFQNGVNCKDACILCGLQDF